jgi:hypothetical protein
MALGKEIFVECFFFVESFFMALGKGIQVVDGSGIDRILSCRR